jgi:putative PIN family toxin of toxin-antitoxin system
VSEALEILAQGTLKVAPHPLDKPVSRDSSDDPILGTAVAGKVDYLVSGDKDLLSLKYYRHIHIISPRDFWTKMMESK